MFASNNMEAWSSFCLAREYLRSTEDFKHCTLAFSLLRVFVTVVTGMTWIVEPPHSTSWGWDIKTRSMEWFEEVCIFQVLWELVTDNVQIPFWRKYRLKSMRKVESLDRNTLWSSWRRSFHCATQWVRAHVKLMKDHMIAVCTYIADTFGILLDGDDCVKGFNRWLALFVYTMSRVCIEPWLKQNSCNYLFNMPKTCTNAG